MNRMIVAAKAPNSPNKLKNGSARRLKGKPFGDASGAWVPARDTPFWFLSGRDTNKSASRTSNAVAARTMSGAMRPQSAADTVNVNDIEKSLLVYQCASDVL